MTDIRTKIKAGIANYLHFVNQVVDQIRKPVSKEEAVTFDGLVGGGLGTLSEEKVLIPKETFRAVNNEINELTHHFHFTKRYNNMAVFTKLVKHIFEKHEISEEEYWVDVALNRFKGVKA